MKKKSIIFLVLTVTAVLLSFNACSQAPVDTETQGTDSQSQSESVVTPDQEGSIDLDINEIYDYNQSSDIDSHTKLEAYSELEFNYRESCFFDTTQSGTSALYYPRLKKASDGSYLLFYQNGKTGTSVYVSRSTNLKQWTTTDLFKKSGNKFYATCDAYVLANGDIIAVTSFNGSYNGDAKNNGIAMRRSKDNGVTWSDEQVIYVGTTWEPSVLQLSSGEIQVYWTNTHVGGVAAALGGRADDNSTGTMMIRSFDNGYTWNADLFVAYGAQIIAQQYTKTGSDGKYYSGQMPVAIQLTNGNIALALEARVPKNASSDTYNLSFAYSPGQNSWPDSLGATEQGPSSLKPNMFTSMAGPYLRQFPSGETLLSYHWGGKWCVKIGNSIATAFYDSFEFFKGSAIHQWGALEILSSHEVAGVVPDKTGSMILIGKMILNHNVKAEKLEVSVDAKLDEWKDTSEAFFIGSESQAQASIRCAQDDENVYITAEVLDRVLTDDDRIMFNFASSKISGKVNVIAYANGVVKATHKNESIVDAIEYKILYDGTINQNKDKDEGYVVEIKIPKTMIVGEAKTLFFDPVLYNSDKEGNVVADSIGTLILSDSAKWLRIEID